MEAGHIVSIALLVLFFGVPVIGAMSDPRNRVGAPDQYSEDELSEFSL